MLTRSIFQNLLAFDKFDQSLSSSGAKLVPVNDKRIHIHRLYFIDDASTVDSE